MAFKSPSQKIGLYHSLTYNKIYLAPTSQHNFSPSQPVFYIPQDLVQSRFLTVINNPCLTMGPKYTAHCMLNLLADELGINRKMTLMGGYSSCTLELMSHGCLFFINDSSPTEKILLLCWEDLFWIINTLVQNRWLPYDLSCTVNLVRSRNCTTVITSMDAVLFTVSCSHCKP